MNYNLLIMKKICTAIVLSGLHFFVFAQTGYILIGEISGLKDGSVQLKRAFDKELVEEMQVVGGVFKLEHPGDFVGEKVFLSQGDLTLHYPIYLEPGVIYIKGDIKAIDATGTISNETHQVFVRGEL